MSLPYTQDLFVGHRRSTREVCVGDVGIGGQNPIRVQSMTTTDTRDAQATADQAERLAAAGCEIVRITAPSITDAENLRVIADELHRRGVRVPLVADIHFTPNAAMIAAEIVEKVRVNPGNYADKKKFAVCEYTDAEYAAELERVTERFRPLVLRLKQRGAALRIGTNHGSLSDRIMNRYGDTPRGMVESALEFLDVCEAEAYSDVLFSMKSSNARVAVQAYRLLAARLEQRAPGKPSYPFHVGVTEAGDSEDGRIKSAIGIGSLLEDGIGDTIRVSLTEDPVKEVPVAAALARRAESRFSKQAEPSLKIKEPFCDDPYSHRRRVTDRVEIAGLAFGADEPVRVELDLAAAPADPMASASV
jgi:(E)-4-hydroxy-3-methylbut-2-enyl-diphosphate synthase